MKKSVKIELFWWIFRILFRALKSTILVDFRALNPENPPRIGGIFFEEKTGIGGIFSPKKAGIGGIFFEEKMPCGRENTP